jgi:acylphosphatase
MKHLGTATGGASTRSVGSRQAAATVDAVHGEVGEHPDSAGDAVRLNAFVRGRVQGVGFRWWVRARALELGLVGHAANLDDGRVEVVAEGPREPCEHLLRLLREEPSSTGRPGHVTGVGDRWTEPRGTATGFIER